jgi:hypothetical protein
MDHVTAKSAQLRLCLTVCKLIHTANKGKNCSARLSHAGIPLESMQLLLTSLLIHQIKVKRSDTT